MARVASDNIVRLDLIVPPTIRTMLRETPNIRSMTPKTKKKNMSSMA
jgi:hypothetical protein